MITVFNILLFSKSNLLKFPIEANPSSMADFCIKKQLISSYAKTIFGTAEHYVTVFNQILSICEMMNQEICCYDLSQMHSELIKSLTNTFTSDLVCFRNMIQIFSKRLFSHLPSFYEKYKKIELYFEFLFQNIFKFYCSIYR